MNMWNERFGEEGFAYGTEPNDFLREHAHRLQNPCLSLAEGEGRNAIFLASRGLEVTAVDGSEVGLNKARQRANAMGLSITTIHSDLSDYQATAANFGSIISIFAHVPKDVRRRLHADVVRWLKPGGIFLLEAYTPAQVMRPTGGPRDPELCMALDDLRGELTGLKFEIARECDRNVVEGRYHTGLASVVQILAIRT